MSTQMPSEQPAKWLGLPVIATIARLLCQELTLQNEYLSLENKILKSKIVGRICFTDDERRSLVDAALAMGHKLMESVVNIVKPATIPAWQRRMIKPMLAQARSEPFNCDKHLFEVKWDGTRCLGFIEDDRLRLQNRHLMDIGDRYPELACLRGLPAGTVIDDEIVVLRHGRPSFQKLQQRDHLQDPIRIEILSKRMPVKLMAFDLPYVRGRRITSQPLTERRQRLIDLVGRLGQPLLIVPDCVAGHGMEFFAGIVRHRLEGMMAKRLDSPYLIGKRSSDCLKIKVAHTADFEVIGCVPMRGEKAVRALLLGERVQGRLMYKGSVGSGLTRRQRQDFLAELAKAPKLQEPVDCPSESICQLSGWRCRVRYFGLTEMGHLRSPTFERGFDLRGAPNQGHSRNPRQGLELATKLPAVRKIDAFYLTIAQHCMCNTFL